MNKLILTLNTKKTDLSSILSCLLVLLLFLSSTDLKSQTSYISSFFPEIKILESNDPAPGNFFIAAKGVSAPGAKLYIAIVDNYGTPVFSD